MSATRQRPTSEHLVGCVPLAVGDTLRIVDPCAVYVHVAQGRAWITEERASADVVLAESEGFRLARRGAAVVEALAPTVLLLTSPRERGFARAVATAARPPHPAHRRRRRSALRGVLAALRGRCPAWLLALAAPSRSST
ncbi:MAG: DUF2917 domain-containing protein [Burkholderiales bacterium]